MKIKIKKLHPDAVVPSYAHEHDAGLDLHAYLVVPRTFVFPGDVKVICTGIAVEIPPGYEGQIRPRSGLAKRGLMIPNAPGTLDAGYRGEVAVLFANIRPDDAAPLEIEHGDRIAQLVIAPVVRAEIEVVEELASSERGDRGFGSSGR